MLTYDRVRRRLYAATDFGAYTVKASARNWSQILELRNAAAYGASSGAGSG
jgi:hypothetical protein